MIILKLKLENDFSLEQTLVFLKRSDFEITHLVIDDKLLKPIKLSGSVYFLELSREDKYLNVKVLNKDYLSETEKYQVEKFVKEYLDLDNDLSDFYNKLMEDNSPLNELLKYKGTRIVTIPDLFEAIIWAIIGQHINLKLAYSIKKELVERFGEKVELNGYSCYLFPTPENLKDLTLDDLLKLRLTKKKSEYIYGAIKLFLENPSFGKSLSNADLIEELLKLRGIGTWTANYVMLRYRRYKNAFPVGDIGILHAIRNIYKLNEKPGKDFVDEIYNNLEGYKGLLTYYLWRSLYD